MTILDFFFVLVYIVGVLGTYSVLREPPNSYSPMEVLLTAVFPTIWPLYWMFVIGLIVFKLDKSFLLLVALLFIASSCAPCHTPRIGLNLDPGEYDEVTLAGRTGGDLAVYWISCNRFDHYDRFEVTVNATGQVVSWKKL